MQSKNLESLLKKAKEHEKKYEWLQAAENYKKANNFTLVKNDLKRSVELDEKIGFCFYRSARQAQNKSEFNKCMKLALQAYQSSAEIIGSFEEKHDKIRKAHIDAWIIYIQAWLENDLKKKKNLLDRWWELENQASKNYEIDGDLRSYVAICNNLLEQNIYDRFWLISSGLEQKQIYEECLSLGEKAIKIAKELNDDYELARSYAYVSWYHIFSYWLIESDVELIGLQKKGKNYSHKALELAQKIDDPWLISWSNHSISVLTGVDDFDFTSSKNYSEKMQKYSKITRDKYLVGLAHHSTGNFIRRLSKLKEDPDKQREGFERATTLAKEALNKFQTVNNVEGMSLSYPNYIFSLTNIASIETNLHKKRKLLENTTDIIQQGIGILKGWTNLGYLFGPLVENLLLRSEINDEIEERRRLLQEAKGYAKKQIEIVERMQPFAYREQSVGHFLLASIYTSLANIALKNFNKNELLNKAIIENEKAIKLMKRRKKMQSLMASEWFGLIYAKYYRHLGVIRKQIYYITKDETDIDKSIEAYKESTYYYKKAKTPTSVAESYWSIAQLYYQKGDSKNSSLYYQLASEAYHDAGKNLPKFADFYNSYSNYMQAWSQIERAKHSHAIEDYEEARLHYEQAAKLHESTSLWNYLAPNYFAWSYMEKAEGLSRKENTQQAKQVFQKAHEQFCNVEQSLEQKVEEITSTDEKEMIQKLLKSSKLRSKYCQARILMEEAKLLDRKGKYLESSTKYKEASKKIASITEKIDETERKELEYLAILCQAWDKMAKAEETTSSESYLEAAGLFEQAKDYCYTKKASLWALGNSSFCRGLAAGIIYQTSADLRQHSKAKSLLKNAANSYLQAGFKHASEYVKATQRLFDAYLSMNQAETEADQEKRAKHYQMAESLLQIAAGSFLKAKQPEKQAQIQEILSNVREEKALAVSLSQVMQAPTIASSTLSFAALTPTKEVAIGLEKFEHANIQANLVTTIKQVKVGESFCLSVEFVNAGREPALLLRVDDFVPSDFVVVKKPEIYRIEETTLNMKGKQLAPLKLVEVKLTLQPSKKGDYSLNPMVHYLDELGQNRSLQLKTIEITVEEILLEDRVTTGTEELDSLLLGGIPKEYVIALAGPPCDEREMIVKNFLKTGIKKDETTFYIATQTTELKELLNKPNFFLFLCNPKPKTEVPDIPNVYKLQSKTDITNLGIALTKAYRNIDQSITKRRICIEILSDVLVKHGVNTTREWISGLITDLGAKGFTMLAVMDPKEHPPDQATTVLNLFDGEISILQSDDPLDCKKSILVKKLRNQDYIKNPICLR